MSKIKEHLDILRSLKTDRYPREDIEYAIHSILNTIGKKMPLGCFILHAGSEIIRVRPNRNFDETFNTRSELHYKPQEFNTTYQRASTPNQTIFYGSLTQQISEKVKVYLPRLASTLEAIPWIRDNDASGMQKITYSRWKVVGDIPLYPVVFNSTFTNNPLVKRFMDFTISYIKEQNPEDADDILSLFRYISNEFGKIHVSNNDYHYLITSIFTEILLSRSKGRFHGIIYPSTRVYGDDSNVAIHPDVVDNNLDLIAVGESVLYKENMNIIIDNLTVTENPDLEPLTDFQLIPVDRAFL